MTIFCLLVTFFTSTKFSVTFASQYMHRIYMLIICLQHWVHHHQCHYQSHVQKWGTIYISACIWLHLPIQRSFPSVILFRTSLLKPWNFYSLNWQIKDLIMFSLYVQISVNWYMSTGPNKNEYSFKTNLYIIIIFGMKLHYNKCNPQRKKKFFWSFCLFVVPYLGWKISVM